MQGNTCKELQAHWAIPYTVVGSWMLSLFALEFALCQTMNHDLRRDISGSLILPFKTKVGKIWSEAGSGPNTILYSLWPDEISFLSSLSFLYPFPAPFQTSFDSTPWPTASCSALGWTRTLQSSIILGQICWQEPWLGAQRQLKRISPLSLMFLLFPWGEKGRDFCRP